MTHSAAHTHHTRRATTRTSALVSLVRLVGLATACLLAASAGRATEAASLHPTPAAAALESAFPSAAGAGDIRGVHPVRGNVVTPSGSLFQQAAAAYSAVNQAFKPEITVTPTLISIRADWMKGLSDFAVLTASPTAAELVERPTLKHYPLQGVAVVVAYNLPASATANNELLLSGPLMCKIFRANITRWNDPLLQAANPLMSLHLAVMPDGSGLGRPIQVQQLKTNSAGAMVWTSYCSKIDPVFKATIGVNGAPKLPFANFSTPVQFYPNIDQANSALKELPWGIGIVALSNAMFLGNSVALFLNARGQVVRPTSVSMALNLFELATDGYPAGTNSYDLTNPSTAQAWPMMSISYIWLDASSTRTTCRTKHLMIDFMIWFLRSDIVAQIGASLYSIVFPAVLVEQLRLIERLQTEVTCDGSLAPSSTRTDITYVATNALGAGILTMLSTFYRAVDPTVHYAVRTASETLSVHRLLTGETSLALLNPASLTAEDTALLRASDTHLLPMFLTGVVPIFNLPAAVLALWTSNAALQTPDENLPALYPLRMSLECLAALFLGDIASWLDPQIVALNPQLPAWFTASSALTNLSVLVGASSPSDPVMGGRLLFQSLLQSQTSLLPRHAYTHTLLSSASGANPFAPVVSLHSARVSMIDTEARLPLKLATKPGSVSYRMAAQVTDVKSEFQWVQTNAHGIVETVAPQVSAMAHCGSDQLALPSDASELAAATERILDLATQQSLVSLTRPTPGCYPLVTVMSFAVQPTFTGTEATCTAALHALEFMHYIQSQDVLSAPMQSLGLVRLADWPLMREVTDHVLAATSCNGEALIFMQPRVFSVSDATRGAATGIAIIFFIVLIGSALAIALKRSSPVLTRDSAPAFQVTLLSGMILFTSALLPWTAEPSEGSCQSLVWLVCLGFTLLYAPQVASLWQAWRFAGMSASESKQQRILRLTGLTLPATLSCAALLAVDLMIVGLWSNISPLRPQEFSRSNGVSQEVFTHCSIDESTGAGWAFVITTLIVKAGLILLGMVLAMYGSMQRLSNDAHLSRRHSFVATLTARRQRRSLYLLVCLSVIIIAALVATAAVQSTLILLVALFLILNVAGSWSLIFLPRFQALLKSDGGLSAEEAELSGRGSRLDKSGGSQTSHLSVGISAERLASMDAKKLQAYLQKLQAQAQFASRELQSRTKDVVSSVGSHMAEGSLLFSSNDGPTSPVGLRSRVQGASKPTSPVAARSSASTLAWSVNMSPLNNPRADPAALVPLVLQPEPGSSIGVQDAAAPPSSSSPVVPLESPAVAAIRSKSLRIYPSSSMRNSSPAPRALSP